jgi:uncharacterized protein (DUF779 family)
MFATVINGWDGKLMVAMEVTNNYMPMIFIQVTGCCCYGKSMVAMERRWLLWN